MCSIVQMSEFASWKLSASEKMDELIALEQRRYQLAQQLLMMDLHQKATYGQFKELLAKIGSFTPTLDSHKQMSRQLPVRDKSTVSDIHKEIESLFQRCNDCKARLNEYSERIFFETSRNDILTKLADKLPPEIPTEEEVDEPITLFEMKAEQTAKAKFLDDRLQVLWRQTIFLSSLELKLQNQLEKLLKISEHLVSERKWHCDGNIQTRKGPLVFFYDSFSVC